MNNKLFKTSPDNGITIVRRINFNRGPVQNSQQMIYGVGDRDIWNKGMLNFNYHPDQHGVGFCYNNGMRGTKVDGLPVSLMESLAQANLEITTGLFRKASTLRSNNDRQPDGAILVVNFTPDQIERMGGLGINLPYTGDYGDPTVLLKPYISGDNLMLKIKNPNDLVKLNFGLADRFDRDGQLCGTYGEYFIPRLLQVEEYRENIHVFRPNKVREGFHSYRLSDVTEGREDKRFRL